MAAIRGICGTGLLVFGLACALPPVSTRASMNSHLITTDEIDGLHAATAHEVIQKLRPNFLSYRGETSFNKSQSSPFPTVWLDGISYGSIEVLRSIPAMQIASIRLYRAWEATTKFGMGNMGGVLEITTRQ
jgi:hypothetical protein